MCYVVGYLNDNALIQNPYNAEKGCDTGNPPGPRLCRNGVYFGAGGKGCTHIGSSTMFLD